MALFEPPSNLPVGKEPEDIFSGTAPTPAPRAPGMPQTPPAPRPSAPGVPPLAVRPTYASPPTPPLVRQAGLPPRAGLTGLPATPDHAASIAETPVRGFGRKIGRLLLFAVVVAAVVIAGYFAYQLIIAPRLAAPTPAVNLNVNRPPVNTNRNVPSTPPPTINTNAPVVVPPVNVNTPPPVNENTNVNDQPNASTDTDGDGLADADEKAMYRTDPLDADTDNDGLTDREEVITWKTDPLDADTDNDTYSDGVEVKGGYNPNGSGKLLPALPIQ